MARHPKAPPSIHDYDIRLRPVGSGVVPVLLTWYKGHAFEGWISQEKFEQAERDGVLSWDASNKPVIRTEKNQVEG